ncbi:hypothetical protein HDA39_008324 [Kribbella italica]|uniref:FAD-binding PCMH-type domain-containing protein n=1 Tax=Kribbella italica TaxID=1540520 RepID=A0A7W9MZL2_9ACTN|nr:hypothetical protein [Kribbella italica]
MLTAEVESLRQRLTGTVALPQDAGYKTAEPWNLTAVVNPAAVVLAANSGDVAEAVRFATAHRLKLAVQATGHGGVSLGADVLLVHTGGLSECSVDAAAGTARVGAGVTAQQLIDAATEHGLAPILGSAGTVSVAGFISGGGVGPLVTTFGLSSDYVQALDVVTADGEVRRVSATDHPELFWAFRGGKGTVGIITAIELELVRLETLQGGALYFDGADASVVLRTWAEWSANVPDEVTTSVALVNLPAVPGVPEVLAGRLTVAVRFASTLSQKASELVLAPLRSAGVKPILDSVGTMPYRDIGHIHAEPAMPMPLAQDQRLLTSLPTEAIDAIVQVAGPDSQSPLKVVEIRRLGGALSAPRGEEGAFSNRELPYALTAIGLPGDAVASAISETFAGVSSWSNGASFVNFAVPGDPGGFSSAYDDDTRRKLAQLAERYDPNGILLTAGWLSAD